MINSVSHKYVSYVWNPKLMNNVMWEIKVIIPVSIQEQNKIADFLSGLDEKIEILGSEIESAKVWKKGLLQNMFV